MSEFPSIKTHPVMVTLLAVVTVIGLFIAGVVLGYTMRVWEEDSANLLVVTDDVKAEKLIEKELNDDLIEVYNNAEVLNSYEEDECAKCLNTPLPDDYFTIMQHEVLK